MNSTLTLAKKLGADLTIDKLKWSSAYETPERINKLHQDESGVAEALEELSNTSHESHSVDEINANRLFKRNLSDSSYDSLISSGTKKLRPDDPTNAANELLVEENAGYFSESVSPKLKVKKRLPLRNKVRNRWVHSYLFFAFHIMKTMMVK